MFRILVISRDQSELIQAATTILLGFVLGYDPGELTSASSDYILIDWKQGNQNYAGYAPAGLAVSHVTGDQSVGEFWAHTGDVQEIARAFTIGSTGWADFATNEFTFEYDATTLRIFVNSVLEFDLDASDFGGAVPQGRLGFYNFSQSNVTYNAFSDDSVVGIEGSATSISKDFTDADTNDTHTATIDWGDGNTSVGIVTKTTGGSGTVNGSHVYSDVGAHAVTVTVADNHGGTASDTLVATVANVAPVITLNAVASINSQGEATLTGTVADPGTTDTFTVDINWGDGTNVQTITLGASLTGSQNITLTHQYLNADPTVTENYTITATATDDASNTGSATTTVQVDNVAPNVAPVVSLNEVTAIFEDGTATLSGTVTDPGTADTFTVDVDWGDGSGVQTISLPASAAGSQGFTLTHQYLDDDPTATSSDSYTITATATDDDTGVGIATTTVQVDNVAPVVVLSATNALACEKTNPGDWVTISGEFVDQGTADTHTVSVDWGDGTSSNSVTNPGDFSQLSVSGGGSGGFIGSHQYLTGGIFNVVATVNDDDLLSDNDSISTFVTGSRIDPTTGQLQIVGTTAADTITFTSLNTWVEACEGANTITGTSGHNIINAGAGADTISVTSGDNTIEAGAGANTITATLGNNEITSGDGADTITVTSGDNTINAGGGANTIVATSGVNEINTGDGADTITTGGLSGGGNTINAGNGANTITTGAGDDTVTGGSGVDTVTTGAGNDVVYAGNGANTITTGAGDDIVYSGIDIDTITTGAGDDTIHIMGGADTIAAGAGTDTLIVDFSAATGAVSINALAGTAAAGYAGNISGLGIATFAGVENFKITSGSSHDIIMTGAGNDVINAGAGNDVISGGEGADTFVFELGSENDVISDFEQGVDMIDVSGYGFVDFNALTINIGTEDSVIDFGAGDTVTVLDVVNLEMSDFNF
jgi:Ca2+-binding RTX toxin-like protein